MKSTLLALLLKLIVFVSVLSRLDFFYVFGHGTGLNRAHVSPFSVAVVTLFEKDRGILTKSSFSRLKNSALRGMKGVATIREFADEFADTQKREVLLQRLKEYFSGNISRAKSSWVEAHFWSLGDRFVEKSLYEKQLKRLVFPGESDESNYLLIIGAFFVLLSLFVAVASASSGAYLECFGISLMYFGSSSVSATTITETAVCLVVLLVVVTFILERVNTPPATTKGKKIKTN